MTHERVKTSQPEESVTWAACDQNLPNGGSIGASQATPADQVKLSPEDQALMTDL